MVAVEVHATVGGSAVHQRFPLAAFRRRVVLEPLLE